MSGQSQATQSWQLVKRRNVACHRGGGCTADPDQDGSPSGPCDMPGDLPAFLEK